MSMSQTEAEQRIRNPRQGSTMSDRQVAYAVKDGRMVTVTLPDGQEITGYIFGKDDYHWALVTPDGEVALVHKSAPALRISATSSLSGAVESVRDMVEIYRQHVISTYFNQTPSRRQIEKDAS